MSVVESYGFATKHTNNCYVNIRNVKMTTRSYNKNLKTYQSDGLTTDVLTTIDFYFGQQTNNTCVETRYHMS